MLRHTATLLWNTRRTGLLLLAQILLAFIVLFAVFSYAGSTLTDYREGLGFRVEDTYLAIPPIYRLEEDVVPELLKLARDEFEALPEVRGVSLVGFVTPFGDNNMGYGTNESGVDVFTRIMMADEHLGTVMEVPMTRGRWYTPEDTIGGRRAIVVNEAFVRDNFPGGNLVDTSFLIFGRETTIVGIAKNFKYRREFEAEEPLAITYVNPYSEEGAYAFTSMLIHTEPDAPARVEEDIFERMSSVIRSRDGIIQELEVLRQRTSRSSVVLLTVLLSICAFLVASVALGLFGILINAIAKRHAEIGLRKALGATGRGITAQFTLEIVLIAGLGILLGSLIAIQIPLFEIIVLEPRFFWYGGLAAAGLILLLVLLCAIIPSGQAARIHPAIALRSE